MLMIYEKEIRPDCLTRVTQFFNYKKKKEWFSDPFVREVIKAIDDCEVVKDEYIECKSQSPSYAGENSVSRNDEDIN